jgi:transaldolase
MTVIGGPGILKLLVDSADVAAWERLMPSGVFYGITTNPKLLVQAGAPCTLESLRHLASAAFELGAGELHLQSWGESADELLAIGRELASIDPRVVVKIPGTRAGFLATRGLVAEGVGVTLTALYASHQVLAAMALGARYAVPYLGRMNDAGLDGLGEVAAMQEMLDALASPTQILLASVRQLSDLVFLARRGVNVITLQPPLAAELLDNPLSIQAAADFEANARAAGAYGARK